MRTGGGWGFWDREDLGEEAWVTGDESIGLFLPLSFIVPQDLISFDLP